MEGGQKINKVDATSGVPEDAAVFVCPVAKMVRQLLLDVAEIKKQIAKPSDTEQLDNAALMQQYNISRSTAAEWRNTGLCHSRIGKKLYYTRADIEDFLEKHKHKGF